MILSFLRYYMFPLMFVFELSLWAFGIVVVIADMIMALMAFPDGLHRVMCGKDVLCLCWGCAMAF